MALRVLIAGGGAGGASAAARLRRLDESAVIIMFERGGYISYASCGLPYYIGEIIKERDKLLVVAPEEMKKRFNVDVRLSSEVMRIDTAKKLVEVCDKTTGKIYTEGYDKLVIALGAEPVRPTLTGMDSPRVFTLRNIPDTLRIKEYIDAASPKRALVVGAGFIGLEVAENLHRLGIKVAIVELAEHVIGSLDYEMAAIVHQHLRAMGVELYLKEAVKAFNDGPSGIEAELAGGRVLNADMAVLGIGVRPETSLASKAGIRTGAAGGILTDEYMRTSEPDIYAVGDAVEVKDFVGRTPALLPLAGPANKQGRTAASNICGGAEKYEGTQGTSIVKVFDVTVAATGVNEKRLAGNRGDYEKSYTHPLSHAGYYPGATPMSIKLLFSRRDGKVLGAQIVGCEGVDKRIDVISTAIRAGMTVADLEKLELAYAPPYSSAKDPVNIAGYVASNVFKGAVEIFHWDEVQAIDRDRAVLIDVREPEEYGLGTIEGAINIPLGELRERLTEIPTDREVYIFCQVGLRGYSACRILMQKGFKRVKNLSGGLRTYQPAVKKQINEDTFEYDAFSEIASSKPADLDDECAAAAEIEVDACGLQCPGPIMKLYEALKSMDHGETLRITATDPAFGEDVKAWCSSTGNRLMGIDRENNAFTAIIKKEAPAKALRNTETRNGKTMVIFSNDLDRVIASFIIANGAAAMGRRVTMFFTFWGLNILRKPDKVKVEKDIFGRLFGFMMPRGSKKLKLSKMNMLGIGGGMVRALMKKKNAASLEELMEQARSCGVELVACNMSMDIMGIQKEELIDGVRIGGVAAFLGAAEQSDMNMFI